MQFITDNIIRMSYGNARIIPLMVFGLLALTRPFDGFTGFLINCRSIIATIVVFYSIFIQKDN